MRRSRYSWGVFALCVAAVLTGMGWASHTVLRLDRAQSDALRQAALEERVRLALWRMDSALTPLIALENARPYFAYTAFYPLERAYTRMYSEIQPDEVMVPSPLLTATPAGVLIHFQFAPGGELSSPQAPTGNMRDLAESGYVTHDRVESATRQLQDLGRLLGRDWLLAAVAKDAAAGKGAVPGNHAMPGEVAATGKAFAEAGPTATTRTSAPPTSAPVAGAPRGPEAPAELPRGRSRAPLLAQGNTSPPPAGRIAQQQMLSNAQEWQARNQSQRQAVAADNANFIQAPVASTPVLQGELKALWNGSTLVLARSVSVGGQEYLQGCWLDWPGIRQWLLDMLPDLLPGADLLPDAGDGGQRGSRRLANLPLRIVPGAVEGIDPPARAALWMSLTIAWACVVLAAAVAGRILQQALSLSERRGAFVSAVTHEMRTPLTTFRMYTEMLSLGMVKDEERRRKYLEVLTTEADRLSHLVENVLSYARLEGERSGAAEQTMGLGELVQKVEARLARRAALAGMQLVAESPAPGGPRLRADLGAVEQILMNLVDNACKYASSAVDKTIHLAARAEGGTARLAVRDHGPGVSAEGARRLFQPFRKSAHQAAESAPGIGLGLSLSRRLARNMGGDLRLAPSEGQGQVGGGGKGACFVLSLPLAPTEG